MYRASCTVYYPDQQMHNMYIYIYVCMYVLTRQRRWCRCIETCRNTYDI